MRSATLQRAFLVVIRQQKQKLLAAPANRLVRFAQRLSHFCAQRLQYFVADGVSVAIVASLEMIDIDHAHAPGLIVAPGQLQLPLEQFDAMVAGDQAG